MKHRIIFWISIVYSSLFALLFLVVQSNQFLTLRTHNIPSVPAAILIITAVLAILILSIKLFSKYSLREKAFGVSLVFTVLMSPFGDYCLPFLGLAIIFMIDATLLKKLFFSYDRLDYSWSVFLAWCIFVSFSAQIDKTSSFGMTAALFGYGVLFKIFRHADIDKKFLKIAVRLFAVSLNVVILFALYQKNLNQDINLFGLKIQSQGYPGIASFMSNWPANTAGFLVMSLAIMAYQSFTAIYYQKSIFRQLFFLGTSAIILIGMLATETRMAILFVIGFLFSFVIYYPFKKFRKQRFILLLLPILLMPLLATKSTKWQETLTKPLQQATIQDRIHQNQYGFKLWQEHPIKGVGLLNFRYFYDQYGEPIIKKLRPGHGRVEFLHNIYMSMLVETGAIGLYLFLISIFVLARKLWKKERLFALCFLAGILTAGLVDGWLFVLRFSLMMFMILGYSYQVKFKSPKA